MHRVQFLGVLAIAALALVAIRVDRARADECLSWRPLVPRSGVDGLARSLVAWDPDGDGPLPERAVFSGNFRTVGKELSPLLGIWDGGRARGWDGPPLPPFDSFDSPYVYLATKDNTLFALYNNQVWELTGLRGEWRPFGPRVTGYAGSAYLAWVESVPHVVVWQGNVSGVLRLVGSQWQSVGTFDSQARIRGIISHHGDLVAYGYFNSIDGQTVCHSARLTASGWQTMGRGVNKPQLTGEVELIFVHQDELWASGNLPWDSLNSPYLQRLARWDGLRWINVQTPAEFQCFGSCGGSVWGTAQVTRMNGGQSGGLITEKMVVKLTGGTSQAIRDWPLDRQQSLYARCPASVQVQGKYVVSSELGPIYSDLGPTTALAVLDENGRNLNVGDDRKILRLVDLGDAIVTLSDTGNLTRYSRNDFTIAEELPAPRNGGSRNHEIADAAVYNDRLYVCGRSYSQSTQPIYPSPVFVHQGGDWHTVGPPNQLAGDARQLFVYRGRLFAAGHLFVSGLTSPVQLVEFDGTRWKPALGWTADRPMVTFASPNAAGNDGTSLRWAAHGDTLMVAGGISSIAGVPAQLCAQFDGTTWRSLSAGLTTVPVTFGFVSGSTYASTNNGLLHLQDSTWVRVPLQYPMGAFGRFSYRIAEFEGRLLVAGSYQDSTYAQTGSNWQSISPRGDGSYSFGATQIASLDGKPVLVGFCWGAGSRSKASVHAYQLSGDHVQITMATNPEERHSVEGRWNSFSQVLEGSANIRTAELRKDGQLLSPGLQQNGTELQIRPSSFDLRPVHVSDSGVYEFSVRSICGDEFRSNPMRLVVYCLADANRDGRVETTDLLVFLNDWIARRWSFDGPVSEPPTVDSLTRFLAAWFRGC